MRHSAHSLSVCWVYLDTDHAFKCLSCFEVLVQHLLDWVPKLPKKSKKRGYNPPEFKINNDAQNAETSQVIPHLGNKVLLPANLNPLYLIPWITPNGLRNNQPSGVCKACENGLSSVFSKSEICVSDAQCCLLYKNLLLHGNTILLIGNFVIFVTWPVWYENNLLWSL